LSVILRIALSDSTRPRGGPATMSGSHKAHGKDDASLTLGPAGPQVVNLTTYYGRECLRY
jgi:hypothetical protein